MENLRGAALMVLAMFGFAIEDTFIKLMSETMSVGQILIMLGLGGAAVFSLLALLRGQPPLEMSMLRGASGLRALFEGVAALCFVTALALVPISVVTTIIQANPLLVTMGAALFLGEAVGHRRWTAIAIGLCGVLIVLRPFDANFEIYALLAVAGVVAMSARDLVTRRIGPKIGTLQLAVLGFLASVPAGIISAVITGSAFVLPDARAWLLLVCAIGSGVPAIYCIIAAMRAGDISFIAPFRYSRILFGLSLGVAVFSEPLDRYTLIGAAIIAGSGIYTVWRERRLRRPVAAISNVHLPTPPQAR